MKLARLHSHAYQEPYWHVQLAILAAIILQLLLSARLSVGPKLIVAAAEGLLLIALTVFTLQKPRIALRLRRMLAILLIAIISLANISSLVLIINDLLGSRVITGKELLLSGLAIYLTNIIIFGLWYWELDDPKQGGKGDNIISGDFLFPQMTINRQDWSPTFFDYLYISITNASAFSPTDSLPLTHRIKLLMTLQSLTSLVTVALVAARAVNILS
jgi:uncharacterized membrane protein